MFSLTFARTSANMRSPNFTIGTQLFGCVWWYYRQWNTEQKKSKVVVSPTPSSMENNGKKLIKCLYRLLAVLPQKSKQFLALKSRLVVSAQYRSHVGDDWICFLFWRQNISNKFNFQSFPFIFRWASNPRVDKITTIFN